MSITRGRQKRRGVLHRQAGTPRGSVSPAAQLAAHDLDAIAAAWTRVGVLFGVLPATSPVDLEVLICATAQAAPADERLFVCAASWLATHHGFVNGRRLSALAAGLSATDARSSAVLGATLSLADTTAGGAPALGAALAHCHPLSPPQPLFTVMGTMRTLRERVRQQTLPVFATWGLWHDDATLKPTAIRPVTWLLGVPELRVRALLGPSVEADLMTRALEGAVAVRDVARATEVSYAAAHAAADRLVARGLLTRERAAQRLLLRPTALARAALVGGERVVPGAP